MNGIDFSRIRSLTARQIVNALQRDGFEMVRQRGSHRHFYHPDGRLVMVAYHRSGDTYPLRRLRQMLQLQARWTWDDLRRLGLA